MKLTSGSFHFILSILATIFVSMTDVTAQEKKKEEKQHPLPEGSVGGKIRDGRTNEPVSFATITLLKGADSSLVNGALSDENGNFLIEQIPPGNYKIKIKYMGYASFFRDSVVLGLNKPGFSLGVIVLIPSGKQLETIVVKGNEDNFKLGIEKKVFEVENDLLSKGGSATDVIKGIPALSVDIDGNVTLRGSGTVTVLIDGRPSGILASSRTAIFDQIPASSIERIELITNPSAKYDPDGVSGIVNIVLKKNAAPGTSVSIGVSYSTLLKGNASVSIGHRTAKLNVYANYSYRYTQKWYKGYTDRENLLMLSRSYTNQNSDGIRTIQTHLFKAGLDYSFNAHNTLSLTAAYNRDRDLDNDSVSYHFLDANQQLTKYSYRNMYGNDLDQGGELTALYTRSFDHSDKLFTVEMAGNQNRNQVADSIGQTDFTPAGIRLNANPLVQHIQNQWLTQNYFIKADLLIPLNSITRLETGIKFNERGIRNDLTFQAYDFPSGAWKSDTGLTNSFAFTERIYSAYTVLSRSYQKMALQAGGRVEEVTSDAGLVHSGIDYSKNNLHFFPSATIRYKPSSNQEFRFAYSRLINRPAIRFLNPFPDYTDPLNLRYGNPNLNPEFTHSTELSWMRYFSRMSLNFTLYYRYTSGAIQLYRIITDTITGATSGKYQNLNYSTTGGAEFICKVDPVQGFGFMLNLNLYHTQMNGDNIDPSLDVQGYAGFGKLTTHINLTKKITFQLAGVYYAPTPTGQGMIKEQYSMDAGLRMNFLHDRMSLVLSVNDVFNTLHTQVYTSSSEFTQDFRKKRESRIGTLSLTWRLGSTDTSKKARNAEEGNPATPPLPESE